MKEYFNSQDLKPNYNILIIVGLLISFISFLIIVNNIGLIEDRTMQGNVVNTSTNWLNLFIVIITTALAIYVSTIIIQKMIHNRLVKGILGLGIMIFAIILFPDTVKRGIAIIPLLIVIGLFALAVYLLGNSLKK